MNIPCTPHDPAVANLPESLVGEAGPALTLELEVAGRLIPLLGKTYRDVTDQLTPGLDGVAVRRGDQLAMLFPAQMRATNTADRVERLLPPLAQQLGVEPQPLPELTRRFDVSMYRVRTTDLVQAARASGAPELAVARRLVALPEIPLLSNGKTDYVSLKSLVEDDTYGRLLSAAAGRSITSLQEDNADSTVRAAGRQSPPIS